MSADARDDNMFASVTSADSVTEHIEEPREVPESSMSSIFFRQEQCLVILKQYTLKRAGQDNHRTLKKSMYNIILLFTLILS